MTLDWHTILGTLSGLILLGLTPFYIRTIFSGDTKPNPISWLGWALLGGIATAAQFSGGASWSVVIPLVTTFNCLIIIVIALRVGKVIWTKLDGLCIALGLISIIAWYVTSEPLIAILITMLSDFIFTLPTLLKTYKDPSSEPTILWFIYVVGGILGLAASTSFDLVNTLYPAYVVLGAALIWILSLRKFQKKV